MLIEFVKERDTKNTGVFKEVAVSTPVIGTLYVQKMALQTLGNPDKLFVTLSKDKD